MRRHNARILAVLTLYNIDVSKLEGEDAINCIDNIQSVEKEYEYQVDIDYDFSRSLIENTLKNLNEIDEIISKSLVKYTIDRLSYVDRAIIRLATYEMKYTDLVKNVAINEALLITREYSNLDDDLQVKFNNRVLESVANNVSN
ncbi:MAG: transcription antitermination factor NusB [Acholeplasmatales bacterium]|jgi:N utilization substance protein B|nr:transcription antitermination factor NusB [Acholeplasmatales bacterium]MDD7394644.1 transcription antitermination factor NusB [Acholeplasmatales bacterium]MDY4015999.1 transcription antitermination factor NusB [Bacilli bacterium]